jgi:hypothetical protein
VVFNYTAHPRSILSIILHAITEDSQSANDTPITYPIQLFPEFDSPSPASPVVDLPELDAAQPPSPAPPLEIEQAEELDLLDMHGTSARVSGDRHTPSPLVLPPVVTF